MVPPDPPIFLLNFNKRFLWKAKRSMSQAVKIERTHPKTRTFYFKTIRKMFALRNE
jgi:hypothetical protein